MNKIDEKIIKYIDCILDQAQTGIVLTDANSEQNPVVYVNKYFENMFGYTTEEVLGKNCRFLQNTDRDQEAIVLMREAIQNKKNVTTIVRNYSKEGKLLYNEVTISPIFDENNQIVFFLGIQKDVTNSQKILANLKDIIS